MINQPQEHTLLDPEFEHGPVPVDHRKGFAEVSSVWYSFPLVLTSAVIGGIVTAMLGFKLGILAIFTANILLCIVVGSLSYLAGKTGESFAISAKRTFGKQGYIVATILLATAVIGWFAFMVGLTGHTLEVSFGQNLILMTIIGGALYIGATFIGIKALSILGYIAAPMYIILGFIAVYLAMQTGTGDIFSYMPNQDALKDAGIVASFGLGVTLIFSTFTDSGTMTADFTRWAKDGKQGFLAAFTAFPISKFIAEGIGAVIVATGIVGNPLSEGGDFIIILANAGPILAFFAFIFVFMNLGVACSHCLYNGAVSWSHITGQKMRTLTLVLGAIGIAVALTGVWTYFPVWLNLLGLLVPPIAAIIIMDQIILKRKNNPEESWHILSFIAWGVGSTLALICNFFAPQLSVIVVGLLSSAIVYFIGSKVCK